MVTVIVKLCKDGSIERVVEYTTPPRQAMVDFIMQILRNDYNTWTYPCWIDGMYVSKNNPNQYYYENGDDVYAAYYILEV